MLFEITWFSVFLLGALELYFKGLEDETPIILWAYSVFNYYVASIEKPSLVIKSILYQKILSSNITRCRKIFICISFIIYENVVNERNTIFLLFYYSLLYILLEKYKYTAFCIRVCSIFY